ncbi:hypothetical protein VP01_6311g1, partial [Puccinia sorghi]
MHTTKEEDKLPTCSSSIKKQPLQNLKIISRINLISTWVKASFTTCINLGGQQQTLLNQSLDEHANHCAWSQSFFPSSTGPNNNPPIFLALTSTRCGVPFTLQCQKHISQ